jgi:hypothetical protein
MDTIMAGFTKEASEAFAQALVEEKPRAGVRGGR